MLQVAQVAPLLARQSTGRSGVRQRGLCAARRGRPNRYRLRRGPKFARARHRSVEHRTGWVRQAVRRGAIRMTLGGSRAGTWDEADRPGPRLSRPRLRPASANASLWLPQSGGEPLTRPARRRQSSGVRPIGVAQEAEGVGRRRGRKQASAVWAARAPAKPPPSGCRLRRCTCAPGRPPRRRQPRAARSSRNVLMAAAWPAPSSPASSSLPGRRADPYCSGC